MMQLPTDLIRHESIEELVTRINGAVELIRRGYDSLALAKTMLNETLGRYHDDVFPERGISEYNLGPDSKDQTLHAAIDNVRRNAWAEVFKKSGIRALLSERQSAALDAQIKSGDVTELTVENVKSTLQGLLQNAPAYLVESVVEVYDWLRPEHSGLKTNDRFDVQERAIIGYMVDSYGINHYRRQRFHTLANVLYWLDGKEPPKYPHDLCTLFEDAARNHRQRGGPRVFEHEYMQINWYGNGNAHFRFKRMDLITELNRIAGDRQLKPCNAA